MEEGRKKSTGDRCVKVRFGGARRDVRCIWRGREERDKGGGKYRERCGLEGVEKGTGRGIRDEGRTEKRCRGERTGEKERG